MVISLVEHVNALALRVGYNFDKSRCECILINHGLSHSACMQKHMIHSLKCVFSIVAMATSCYYWILLAKSLVPEITGKKSNISAMDFILFFLEKSKDEKCGLWKGEYF